MKKRVAVIVLLIFTFIYGVGQTSFQTDDTNQQKKQGNDTGVVVKEDERIMVESQEILFDGAYATNQGWFYAVTVYPKGGDGIVSMNATLIQGGEEFSFEEDKEEDHFQMISTTQNMDDSVTYVYNCLDVPEWGEHDCLIIQPLLNGQSSNQVFCIPIVEFSRAVDIDLSLYESAKSRFGRVVRRVQILPWGILVEVLNQEDCVEKIANITIEYDDDSVYTMDGSVVEPLRLQTDGTSCVMYLPSAGLIHLEKINKICLSF